MTEVDTRPLHQRVEDFARELGYDVSTAPKVLCENIRYIPEEMWHENRMKGFGGSDEGSINGTSKFVSKKELIYRKRHKVTTELSAAQRFNFAVGHDLEKAMKRAYADLNGYKYLAYHKFTIIVVTDDDFDVYYPKARYVAENTWSIVMHEEDISKTEALEAYEHVLETYPDARFYDEETDELKDIREITDEEHELYDPIGIVCDDRRQYINANYPCMIGDLDGICIAPDGTKIGLECKTYTYRSPKKFVSGIYGEGGQLKDDSYDMQVKHYMAVCNIDRFDVLACCGNTLNDFTITTIYRDRYLEDEKVLCENAMDNWNRYVINGEPVYETRMSDEMFASYQEILAQTEDEEMADEVTELPDSVLEAIEGLMEIQEENANLERVIKSNKELINNYKAEILESLEELGNPSKAIFTHGDDVFSVSYKGKRLKGKIDEERLSLNYPDIYAQYKTEDRFSAKSLLVSKTNG